MSIYKNNYHYYIIISVRLVLKSCKTRIAFKTKWGMWTTLSQGLIENIYQNQLLLNLYIIFLVLLRNSCSIILGKVQSDFRNVQLFWNSPMWFFNHNKYIFSRALLKAQAIGFIIALVTKIEKTKNITALKMKLPTTI